MTVLQKPVHELISAEFSQPAQANSFYPANDQDNHIHLGVPTKYQNQVAQPGNVFVTYISIKVNGVVLGQLLRCGSGYFDLTTFPPNTPANFRNVLENLDLLVDRCG